jgi:hypothetical protein
VFIDADSGASDRGKKQFVERDDIVLRPNIRKSIETTPEPQRNVPERTALVCLS